nr:hypothetical protein [Maliibacterium massiliense]
MKRHFLCCIVLILCCISAACRFSVSIHSPAEKEPQANPSASAATPVPTPSTSPAPFPIQTPDLRSKGGSAPGGTIIDPMNAVPSHFGLSDQELRARYNLYFSHYDGVEWYGVRCDFCRTDGGSLSFRLDDDAVTAMRYNIYWEATIEMVEDLYSPLVAKYGLPLTGYHFPGMDADDPSKELSPQPIDMSAFLEAYRRGEAQTDYAVFYWEYPPEGHSVLLEVGTYENSVDITLAYDIYAKALSVMP